MKRFNVTGLCIPEKHYMCDVSAKLARCKELIENGLYFAINYPRQYGKTTMQFLLQEEYNSKDDYLVISTSFEGIGDIPFESEENMAPSILGVMAKSFYLTNPELAEYLDKESQCITNFKQLSAWLRIWIQSLNKKVILLIDEVDKASNNQVFVSFLAMLRDKYLDAGKNQDITFQSVVLIGVHDVKALKLKLRPNEERKLNSPWNIAEDLKIEFAFTAKEIEPMIADYAQEHNFNMDISAISTKIHYYTSGNPFLVSHLCKIIDEDLMKEHKVAWTVEDINKSFRVMTGHFYEATNIDSLIKNIQDNDKLYKLVFKVLFGEKRINYDKNNYITSLGVVYAVFSRNEEFLTISNSIYSQIIQSWMLSLEETGLGLDLPLGYTSKEDCVDENGLDMNLTLQKFQEFMKEFYSDKDESFLEKHARFILLAFLKPIVNGKGFLFKEPESSDNRKMDLVITFGNQRFVIELKVWRGSKRYDEGVKQLCNYLDSYSLDEGYMVIFNFNKNKQYEIKQVENSRKNIIAVFV